MMQLGPINIDKSMMPSYDDFTKNPTHLYQLKQERLQNLLGASQMMQPNTNAMQNNMSNLQSPQQSQRWENNNGN